AVSRRVQQPEVAGDVWYNADGQFTGGDSGTRTHPEGGCLPAGTKSPQGSGQRDAARRARAYRWSRPQLTSRPVKTHRTGDQGVSFNALAINYPRHTKFRGSKGG